MYYQQTQEGSLPSCWADPPAKSDRREELGVKQSDTFGGGGQMENEPPICDFLVYDFENWCAASIQRAAHFSPPCFP
jgi:hypothetical protein